MSFLDKMKNLIVAPDTDEEYEDDFVEDEKPVAEKKVFTTTQSPATRPSVATQRSVVTTRTGATPFKIQIQDPLKYDDAPKIIDKLILNDAVVVNFEHLEPELKRQVFDFINGGIYAIEGRIQKVTQDIFILAPKDVAIEGIKEEILESGLYSW